MTIQRLCRLGSLCLVGVLLIFGVISGYEFNQLRFGGPVQQDNQLMSDLVADILPPPEYVIEAYLEVTKLDSEPGTLSERKKRLAILEGQFRDRVKYWQDSNLQRDLKSALIDKAVAKGNAFWSEVDGTFLPAVERGDAAAIAASYARVEQLYAAHRSDIDTLVSATLDGQAKLGVETKSRLQTTVIILSALALVVLGTFAMASAFLSRRVISPLRDLTQAMLEMGRGHNDIEVPGAERGDELGDIARALESIKHVVARQANEDAERRMAVQRQVVGSLGEGLGALKSGDLTHRIHQPFPDDYEALRENFNETVEVLADLISQVSEAATAVKTGATEIASAANDLAERTEHQAASLEETAASMKQITSSVSSGASTASEADEKAQSAKREATDSGTVVSDAVAAMEAISHSSDQMQSIVAIIDGIAFQTNLLALNAGVEAARAGEAGKGFAVVASEVRALALRSSDAAKDIGKLIKESGGEVGNGVQMVRQTHQSLEKIVTRTADVSDLIGNLATSGKAQSTAIEHVNSVVDNLDAITQQNAALVEEASAASRNLSQEANRLANLVSRFDVGRGRRADMTETPEPVAEKRPAPRAAAPRPMVEGNAALAMDADDWAEF